MGVASGRDTFPAVAIALVVAGFLFHLDAVAVHVTVFALVILFFVVSIGHFFYRRYSRRFIPSRDTTELAQQREREMAFLQRSQKSLFLPAASPTTSAKKLNQVAPMTQNTLSPYSNVQARPKTLVKPPPPAAHLPPGPTTLHGTFLGEGPLPAMIAGRTSGAKPPLGKGKHEGKGKGKKGDKKTSAATSSAEKGGSIQMLTVYESSRAPPPAAAVPGADSSQVMSYAHFVSSQMDIELGNASSDHKTDSSSGGGGGDSDGGEEEKGVQGEEVEGGDLDSSILASSSTSSSSLDLGSASS